MNLRSNANTDRVGSLWPTNACSERQVYSAKDSRPYCAAIPLLIALLVVLISLPGCGGCRPGSSSSAKSKAKTPEEKKEEEDALAELEKRKKKMEKPKEDFEPLAVRMLPSNDPTPSVKQPPIYVRPGHWTAVSVTAKTNNFDFPGEMATFAERTVTNEPLPMEDTTARLSSWCPAMLAKGQAKRIEGVFYAPRYDKRLYLVRSELHALRGGRTEVFNTTVTSLLKDYEHLIVVLASGSSTPAAYGHFDKLLSVYMPQVEGVEAKDSEPLRYYHVFRPVVDKTVPLPSNALAWTTIAYVFWDDLDPEVLSGPQRQAMLDWLHWGGQLVISGPNSLDKLRGSYLGPYLPGEALETVKLGQNDFEDLNSRYSLVRQNMRVTADGRPAEPETLRRISVIPERPMVGVELKLHPSARAMEGTGGLVVERRVGGGRIVVTRFPLTDVRIKQWKNFDGFFNSVLLRRPGRVFDSASADSSSSLSVDWNDPNLKLMRLEARLGCTLRYFTRDVAFEEDKWMDEAPQPPPVAADDPSQRLQGRRPRPGISSGAPIYGAPGVFPRSYLSDAVKARPDTTKTHPAIDDWHFCGYGSRRPLDKPKDNEVLDPVGVAAWNDQGAASDAAAKILTDAAGIEIPSADFVIKVLAVYLLVLVPLNWLAFWLVGKIEWAWVAAPLIALVGAGAVIRLAQLDIGFARSRTEVAVLEIQGGYERAHLTRYTALYTSLSSSYTLAFEEPSAVAAPFPAKKLDETFQAITQYTDVSFRRGNETSLTGVQVSSNSTGMVHCEQMLPLGTSDKTLETLRLVGDAARGFSISNSTDLLVRDIGVFRRIDVPTANTVRVEPRIEVASVARLEPASSQPLVFSPIAPKTVSRGEVDFTVPPPVWLDAWEQVPIFAVEQDRLNVELDEATAKTRIRLTSLARLAADRLRLLPGDVRLVGWTDQRLPGMKIRPEAPQNRTFTLVLAHLARGHLPPAQPDRNVAEDYYVPMTEAESDQSLPDKPTDGIDRDTGTNPSP